MSTPPGIILVSHEVLADISQEEMLSALSEDYRALPRHIVSLKSIRTTLADLGSFDWFMAYRNQEAEVKEKLLPVVQANSGWRIQYFGAAPIPLAMALGYKVGGLANCDVYQKLHTSPGGWGWPRYAETLSLMVPLSLSTERVKAPGDIVLRISLSHAVSEDDTSQVIKEPLGQVALSLQTPYEDGLQSARDLEVATSQMSEALDWAAQYRPNAQIHVFASLTVGAAFRFGTCINPTIHGQIHAYQYFAGASPRYHRAFVLQQPGAPERVLTSDDKLACAQLREKAAEELAILKNQAAKIASRGGKTWWENAFPGVTGELVGNNFDALAKISNTAMSQTSVDMEKTETTDGFFFNREHKTWEIGDRLLHAICMRLPEEADQRLAIRLFLLHESIHRETHHLRSGFQIRRFPKVVEILDYQADVWGFVYHLALSSVDQQDKGAGSIRTDLLRTIKIAIQTFWAFDSGSDPSRMEIRRVNRYLIWYWQRLEIEEIIEDDVNAALRILSRHPAVEIAGPVIKVVEGRVFFLLDEVADAEIGLVTCSRLFRFGHSNGSQVKDIIKGFRERDDVLIANSLCTILDQVRN